MATFKKVVHLGNIYGQSQNGQILSIFGVCKTQMSGQGQNGSGVGSNNAPKVVVSNGKFRKNM